MKHCSQILRHIAEINFQDQPATREHLQRRTVLRPSEIDVLLQDLETAGHLETHKSKLWLTEAGWDLYRREKPRVPSPDLLLTHSETTPD